MPSLSSQYILRILFWRLVKQIYRKIMIVIIWFIRRPQDAGPEIKLRWSEQLPQTATHKALAQEALLSTLWRGRGS